MQISLSFEKFDEVLNGSKVSNGMHFLSFLLLLLTILVEILTDNFNFLVVWGNHE